MLHRPWIRSMLFSMASFNEEKKSIYSILNYRVQPQYGCLAWWITWEVGTKMALMKTASLNIFFYPCYCWEANNKSRETSSLLRAFLNKLHLPFLSFETHKRIVSSLKNLLVSVMLFSSFTQLWENPFILVVSSAILRQSSIQVYNHHWAISQHFWSEIVFNLNMVQSGSIF